MADRRYASRQYSYRPRDRDRTAAPAAAAAAPTLRRGSIVRFFLGRDRQPTEIDPAAALDHPAAAPADAAAPLTPADPFWTLILVPGPRPQTLRDLLDALRDRLPDQRTFVVGDASQIPWTPETMTLQRELRLIVTRADRGQQPVLLVSTAPRLDDPEIFLQVVGWDAARGAYQFYDRRDGAWVWAGSSWEALANDTRGNGPFDSHVNGCLNMKELKAPWLHWHSMAAPVPDDALGPNADDGALRTHALWRDRGQAEQFEREVARPGIRRWTAARVARDLADGGGRLPRFHEYFRQVVTTTSVNLVSSPQESRVVRAGGRLTLPLTFFINSDALFDLIGLAPDISVPIVDGAIYQHILDRYDVHVTDGEQRIPGDTHFAFAVPEAAFEDVVILETLLAQRILTPKLAACVLMVDFCNPIFSPRRARMLRHAPETAAPNDAAAFEQAFVTTVRDAAGAVGADGTEAEAEFLAWFDLADDRWQPEMQGRIEACFRGIASRLTDVDRFALLFELAESRRREFRGLSLAEFQLTVAQSNIALDAPFLELTPEGDVRVKPQS